MKKIMKAVKYVAASMSMRGNTAIEGIVDRLATTSIEWIG
jgi:hypothetical protein